MNQFGRALRVQVYGESHGPEIGAILDGVPPGTPIDLKLLASRMAARRPGTAWSSSRAEPDEVEIRSGVYKGHATGAPILLAITNQDVRSQDYAALEDVYRPGHADWIEDVWSHGHRDPRGGGHRSGRLSAPLVAAGAIAEMIGRQRHPDWAVAASVVAAGDWTGAVPAGTPKQWLQAFGDGPWIEPAKLESFTAMLRGVRAEQDSVGGRVAWQAAGIPIALGAPMMDGVASAIGRLLLAIPGVRGVHFGDGADAAAMRGSEHNDSLEARGGEVVPRTNHSGGMQGGRTTGQPLWGNVTFKPTPSIAQAQDSVTASGVPTQVAVKGRHDPCIAVRGAPVVAACVHLALADLLLHQNGVAAPV